jgi:hypothetical protein
MSQHSSAPQQYEAIFSRTAVVVLIVSIIPVVFIIGIVLPIALWPDMSDWIPLLSAVLTVTVSLGLVRFFYSRYATIPADMQLDDTGMRINLERYSPFYRKEYSAAWDAVSKACSNAETRQNKRYYLITFRDSGQTVQLMADEYADEYSETAFGEVLLSYVDKHNEAHAQQPKSLIRRKGS